MKHHVRLYLLVLVASLALPASASAGELTLHPSGFGTMSYSSWKAHEGQPDARGAADQALFFQKNTLTATPVAAVAIIRGVEGVPVSQLNGLAWDHRTDGHCGAGAPRWNVGFETPSGQRSTLFLGCNAAQHQQRPPSSGHGWCRDTQPTAALDAAPPGSTITSLAIVFDEGVDTPNPPPLPCQQEQPAGGFVHLDNITVTIGNDTTTWTSASDNGN